MQIVWRQFAWNAKLFFSGKHKQNISKCFLLKYLPSIQTEFEIFSVTHLSCRVNGLKLLLALNQVVLVLMSGTVNNETKG